MLYFTSYEGFHSSTLQRKSFYNDKYIDFNNSNCQSTITCQSTSKSSSTSLTISNKLNKIISYEKTNKSILKLCISITYASIIVSIMTFPPCISIMKDLYPAYSNIFNYKSLLAVGTIVTMVGKFTLGPPTDTYGGELTMKATMLIMVSTSASMCIYTNAIVIFKHKFTDTYMCMISMYLCFC